MNDVSKDCNAFIFTVSSQQPLNTEVALQSSEMLGTAQSMTLWHIPKHLKP
jgi:hypothetical protein